MRRAQRRFSLARSIEEDGKYVETLESGERKELAPAKLTLNDCLACSGCVTTAETMLIQAQSAAEFFANLKKPEGRTFVVSVSPQVRRTGVGQQSLTPPGPCISRSALQSLCRRDSPTHCVTAYIVGCAPRGRHLIFARFLAHRDCRRVCGPRAARADRCEGCYTPYCICVPRLDLLRREDTYAFVHLQYCTLCSSRSQTATSFYRTFRRASRLSR